MVSADGGVWHRVTKHPATLWSALQHAMMRQWDDYLGRYRLYHVRSGATIPVHELLRFEIRAFRCKKVFAC
jgi:hypothetical protein